MHVPYILFAAISSKRKCMERIIRRIVHTRGDSSYVKDLETFFPFHGQSHPYHFQRRQNQISRSGSNLIQLYDCLIFHVRAAASRLRIRTGGSAKQLYALAKGNLDHILTQGCVQSLTGPLERNDCATVEKHISALNKNSGKYILPVLNISQISHRASIQIVITRR